MSQFGRYTLRRRLASGGMGEVWLAQLLSTPVVIKRVLPQLAAQGEFLDLFVNEARVSARLTHPNVARTLEFGEVQGEYFLALEFVDGLNLAQLPPVTAAQAAAIIAPVAVALDWAHRTHAVVHGDVSPRNVLLRRDGVPKLIDFGLGRLKGSKLLENLAEGALAWRAPEVLEGAEPDARSDQFSLGCVLYGLLAGAPLFDGDSDVEVMARITECRVEPPTHWPEPLREVLTRLLAKEPSLRFAHTQEAAEALNEYLADAGNANLRPLLAALPPVDVEVASPKQVETVKPVAKVRDLSSDELAVVRQLAVGPQTLEALEAALTGFDVLDALQTLVELGVLCGVDDADGERRFHVSPSMTARPA